MTNLQIVFICLFALLVISQLILLYNSKYREQQANRASSDRDELLTFINRYTASIGYVHNTREWMSQVAQFVAQAIEASTVFLIFIENDNEARIVASYGKIPDHEGNISSQSQKLIDDLQAGTIVYNTTGLISEVIGPVSILKQDFHKQYGDGPIDSLVSVPMRIDTEQIGMICAINRNAKIPFNQQSLFLLESLSSQVAFGLTFVEMYERLGKQQRIEQELELAKNIQLSLLPSKAPRHHNYRIYADCIAAREVSGDFFDFIQISDDLLLVVVADASGKGIPACMLMAMCRSILRTNAGRFKEDLEGLMHELNRNLYEDTDASQFITLACLLIDKHDHVVEYARAGHTELLIQDAEGRVEVISPDGPALGLLPDEMSRFDTFAFSWQPGTSLILFSDGITEGLNHDEEEFGLERLINVWKKAPVKDEPEETASTILTELMSFTREEPQADDQTLMILHRPA